MLTVSCEILCLKGNTEHKITCRFLPMVRLADDSDLIFPDLSRGTERQPIRFGDKIASFLSANHLFPLNSGLTSQDFKF